MLDREGYRPNVGIILLNHQNEVWCASVVAVYFISGLSLVIYH